MWIHDLEPNLLETKLGIRGAGPGSQTWDRQVMGQAFGQGTMASAHEPGTSYLGPGRGARD